MKNENGLYKFDIQMFAGTAFEVDAVLPATTQLKIAWTETDPEQEFTGAQPIVKTESDSYDLIFTTDDGAYEDRDVYVNGVKIISGGYWQSTCGDTGSASCSTYKYRIIDTSGWTLSKRTITTVSAGVATVGLTYEDLNASSTWTVTFDSNDGTAVAPITDVEDGATITAPTAPTRENYTFAGWYKEEALTNAWVFASDTVTADTTLYAKWVQGAFEKMQEFARQIVERVNGKASKYPPTNTQDANYTLVLADDGKLILAGHATNAVKVTIPLNATVEFPTNTEIAIVKYLAGDVTIGTASGATLNGEASTTTFEITDQYGTVAIKKVGTDAWIMTGGFEEVV